MGCSVDWQAEIQVAKVGTSLPKQMAVSRALADHRVPIQDIQLHGFGGASSSGVGAAVYAVIKQE